MTGRDGRIEPMHSRAISDNKRIARWPLKGREEGKRKKIR
jgi:hypothetical protein